MAISNWQTALGQKINRNEGKVRKGIESASLFFASFAPFAVSLANC
jgi:hypothetical protein